MLKPNSEAPVLRCLWLAASVILPASVLLLLTGCSQSEPVGVDASSTPVEIIEAEVLTLEMQPWPATVRSQGSLYADEQTAVGSQVAGRVAEVHVDLGDYVNAGDPLVTLDQAEFELQAEQAESQLRQARAAVGLREGDPVEKLNPENAPPVRQERAQWNEAQSSFRRATQLQAQNAISQGDFDLAAAAEGVAEARYASALNGVREKMATIGIYQAELSLARERLRDATIRAPLDGFVRQRQTAPGSYLSVGQSIAVLVRTNPLRFRGTVPERHAQSIAVGQSVRLKIESVSEPRTVTITRVSPTLDQQTRALTFEALVDNSDHGLRAGLFVEAEVVLDPSAEALAVPESAVIEFAGAEKVWKVVDGQAVEQEILIGSRREGQRQVLQGLELGDVILLDATKGRVGRVKGLAKRPNEVPVAFR